MKVWKRDLSTPLPKLCDKLLEPTYVRGGGTLSCQPNALKKALAGKQEMRLLVLSQPHLCGQLVHSSGLTFLICKRGGSNQSNERYNVK